MSESVSDPGLPASLIGRQSAVALGPAVPPRQPLCAFLWGVVPGAPD